MDVVSKNGAVVLNIAPKTNGEAIYETQTFNIYEKGDTEGIEGHLSKDKNLDSPPIRYKPLPLTAC